MSKGNAVVKEIVSLLYWSMLAACTIGPGTVVTCARAGFEQGLSLIWALVFATLMAFTLQVSKWFIFSELKNWKNSNTDVYVGGIDLSHLF